MGARTFHHSAFTAERIATERSRRRVSVSACLPARECAATVGEIVSALGGLREAGVLDRIIVLDAGSQDGTARVAAAAGAEVWQEAELLPSFGAVLGKGDAMWRALSRLEEDVVCFLDADSERFSTHFATGLVGPLVCAEGVSFAKAFYRRPLVPAAELATACSDAAAALGGAPADGADAREGGGRVSRLTARPALALLYPQLAGIRQPLAGEVAARRELLMRIPFATGYGVEVAMLIDVWHAVGLDAIAQVDLDEHFNRHQSLSALERMATTVLATVARRAEAEGRVTLDKTAAALAPLERPPLAGVAAA
jgi:glucosyl-3-phosphoglycerate synthase